MTRKQKGTIILSNDTEHGDLASRLNPAIRALHDEFKRLALTCSMEFPIQAIGGFEFAADIAELETAIASYNREILVVLFQSMDRPDSAIEWARLDGGKFLRMWNERGKLQNPESRSETEIDSAVRKLIAFLLHEMLVAGEEQLRHAVKNESLSEMLYYVSTVLGALCWYQERYLGRLTGQLPTN